MHLVDALVLVAVGALVTGLLGARELGLAPRQGPPPTAAAPTTAPAAPIDPTVAEARPTAPPVATPAAPSTTTVPPPPPDTPALTSGAALFGPGARAAVAWPAAVPAFAVRAPDAADPVRMLVVGDSLAAGLADALARLGQPAGLAVRSRVVASSGLARPDVYDWPWQLASVVDPTDEIVVVAVGTNDAQPLAHASQPAGPPGSAAWTQQYRERLARLVGAAGPRPVVVVGLPAVEQAERDRELDAVRAALAAEAAVHPNVRWFDLRAATSDDGTFARWLDGGDGRQTAARSNDGERFTDAGNDLAAAALVATLWRAPA